jgi:ferredoxin
MASYPPKRKRFLKFKIKGGDGMAYVITDECVACGTCAEECPSEAIEEGEPYVINEEKCNECGTCVEACPVEAIVEK